MSSGHVSEPIEDLDSDRQALILLGRAVELVSGPLPHDWSDCAFDSGPYCPRCAVATAATELFGTWVPIDAADLAILSAIAAVREVSGVTRLGLRREASIAVLQQALGRRRPQ